MKDSIYTIPISEVFEPKRGCPVCALYKSLEERWVDYITGAAMMEPDVRVETNRHGFCGRHFDMMLGQRNRLSVALMLQTRLAWIDENLQSIPKGPGLFRKELPPARDECFVCHKIDTEFRRIGSNIASIWSKEPDFRGLYGEQEYLCYPHAKLLATAGCTELRGASLDGFLEATASLTRKQLRPIKGDVDAFCNLFDYRNAGSAQPDENVSTAIERAIAYLTGQMDSGGTP